MSLKSLIQRLLDSRTTPSEAAHSAMPSSSYVTVTATAVQAWGQMAQGVAPFDGFVRASARASNTSSNIRVTNDTATIFVQSEGTATGQTQGVFVPVAKGDSWSVYGTNRDNVVVRLVKTIGGGYSILLWRALSCLRALSNYLSRSSFRTNPNGSAIKLCQTIQPSGLFTHLKAHPVNTSHRLTGMSLFTPVAMNGRKSGMETEVSSSPQRVLPTSAFKCLSLKAPKLGMSFRTPRPTELKKRPLSLFQQSGRNALTGGALC